MQIAEVTWASQEPAVRLPNQLKTDEDMGWVNAKVWHQQTARAAAAAGIQQSTLNHRFTTFVEFAEFARVQLGRRIVTLKTDDIYLDGAAQTPFVVQCADTSDCTKSVQSALNRGPAAGHVFIPDTGTTPWQVEPLFIHKGGFTLTLASGAVLQAKKNSFRGTGDSLLTIEFSRNVTILASGATLKMRKLDYLPPAYLKAEWRMGVNIRGCDAIKIVGLTVQDAGGNPTSKRFIQAIDASTLILMLLINGKVVCFYMIVPAALLDVQVMATISQIRTSKTTAAMCVWTTSSPPARGGTASLSSPWST
eukprot:SAG31_NODE_3477_length_4226_cov_2.472256_2_plen_307_part_00